VNATFPREIPVRFSRVIFLGSIRVSPVRGACVNSQRSLHEFRSPGPSAAGPGARGRIEEVLPVSQPVVAVSELSRRFGKALALDGLSLELQPGLVYGLVGTFETVPVSVSFARDDAGA
jgi:hypothetical protein